MIMQKIKEFMYGRYGFDQLGLALTVGGFALNVVYVFSRWRIFYLISLICYGIAIYRALSRNYEKRRKKNQKFLEFWYKLKNFWVGLKADFEEKKTYKHFKCPSCKQKIRIPRGRGRVEISCPKCGHKFVKKV